MRGRRRSACYAENGMVVMILTADEARDLANLYGPRDGAYDELMGAAENADEQNRPDPNAPGLRVVLVARP